MRKDNEKGITLILGTLSLLFIIPMLGLAIDVGFLYAVKSKMQAAVDGAALAAARSLSDGATAAAQQASAQSQGVTWFDANFPSNYFGVKNIVMTTGNVVYSSSNNIQSVAVSATAQVDTIFMKWLGFNATTVGANGTASRRDLVVMMVLDRSFSIQMANSCSTMKAAAKAFTGQFAEGRDYIGLISFSDDVLVQSSPTQTFQTTLGYSNSSGSATGLIDNINCQGNTNTAQAISVAYNELWKVNLPGAMNVIMLETDGLPNTLTLNFWDSTNVVSGLSPSSTDCVDLNGKTAKGGGFKTLSTIVNGANVMQWTPQVPLGTSSYLSSSMTYTSGGEVYTPQGIVGAIGTSDPGDGSTVFIYMQQPYYGLMMPVAGGTTTASFESTWAVNATHQAKGCTFAQSSLGPSGINQGGGNNYTASAPTDFQWWPATDVYGNQLDPSNHYQSVSMTADGQHVANSNYQNFHNAAENAADNAAYNARNGVAFPSPNSADTLQATIYVVGLGGTIGSPPDPILMQRIANDPYGDQINATPKFAACSTEATCVSYSSQPEGEFIYSSNPQAWGEAFLQIASQILRLSK